MATGWCHHGEQFMFSSVLFKNKFIQLCILSANNEPKVKHGPVSGLLGSLTCQHIKVVFAPLNKATLSEVLD